MSESMVHINLSDLDSAEENLKQELSQLHHELQRIGDGLERNRASHELEQRAKQLAENIELCEADLKQIHKLLAGRPNAQAADE